MNTKEQELIDEILMKEKKNIELERVLSNAIAEENAWKKINTHHKEMASHLVKSYENNLAINEEELKELKYKLKELKDD